MADNMYLLYYSDMKYSELIDKILKLTKENSEYVEEIDSLKSMVYDLENKIEDLEIDLRLSGREIEKLKGRDLI